MKTNNCKNMLNKVTLDICSILLMISCSSQAQKNQQLSLDLKKDKTEIHDSIHKPKISYKVNKQFDKHGNVIKYDSTYTYVYKGVKGKGFSAINTDSLFSNFNSDPFKMFNESNRSMFNNDLFFSDKFFDNSFFEKQMQLNNNFLHHFLNRIDSTELFYLKNKSSTSNYKKI